MSELRSEISPKDGLTKPADPNSGQQSQFALFSDNWIELQGYIGSALELPLTTGDFETKYGSFGIGGTTKINDCVSAMRSVREAATEFGDPKGLRAALIKDPNILALKEPPKEIYTHTVWLGQRVHETAGKIVTGYEAVLDGLSGLPAKDQVENLKAYLFDATLGPIPLSQQMSVEVGALIKKLGAFEQKMNEYNEKLRAYTRDSSALVQEVSSAIGGLEQKIKDLEKSRDEAYKAWRDFTIAAVTASVGCALIGALLAPFTFGISAVVGAAGAIATAVGLGIKAAENMAAYNDYCGQIRTANEDLKKKQRLRSDLLDFNSAMNRVGPAMANFLKSLQTVEGVWVQINSDMVGISRDINEGNVGSMPFLVKTKAAYAINAWKSIDTAAKQFTVESLVDYTSIPFGNAMPEKLAA